MRCGIVTRTRPSFPGADDAVMALAPNTRIDHYAIAAPVGAGGMGIVYAGAFVFARSEARRELDPETQKVAGIEREASRFADHSTESLRGSLRSVALVLELQGLPEEPSRVIVRDLPEADRVRSELPQPGEQPFARAVSLFDAGA